MSLVHAPRGQWLDLLPPDACELIAVWLSDGRRDKNSLSLARSSPVQRKAVLSTLSYTFRLCEAPAEPPIYKTIPHDHQLDLPCGDEHDLQQWIQLFGQDVQEIDLSHACHRCEATVHTQLILHFLQAPNLRRLAVLASPSLLHAAAQSRSIRHLQVDSLPSRLDSDPPGDTETWFHALSVLPLSSLELTCREESQHCLFQNLDFVHSSRDALVVAFSNLDSLQIQCCPHTDGTEHQLWSRIMTLLPSQDPCPSAGTSDVGFLSDNGISDLIATISARVRRALFPTAIQCDVGPFITEFRACKLLNGEEVKHLAECPRLSTVQIRMAKGAESALVDTVRRLPALTILTVGWRNESAPEDGTMLSTVKAAKLLSEVRFKNMPLPLSETLEILRCLGPRTQVIETTLLYPHRPLCSMEELTDLAVRENPLLRVLQVSWWSPDRPNNPTELLLRQQHEAMEKLCNRNWAALRRLLGVRAVPEVQVEYRRAYIPMPF